MTKKIKFKNIKKVGDINISFKMGGLEKFQMKIAERISSTKSVFSKLSAKSADTYSDISERIKQSNENFESFVKNVDDVLKRKSQEFNQNIKELIDNLSEKTKSEMESEIVENQINGELSAEDVSSFLATLWENHELAQSKFIESGDETFGEMALDIKVAINNIEEIKSYLIDHGKYDTVNYDYTFY